MKVSTLRKIAREYRAVADRKLDDKELCKGFSDLCREEGIAWTQLRGLVDAQAADDRDGGKRVEKIVEKADFASSYADLLTGKDEPKAEIRSSEKPPEKPVQRAEPVSAVSATIAPALESPPASFEMPDVPDFLDRRVS